MTSTTWLAPQPEPGRRFDVCNGDADGLCAVRQWRLHEPLPSTLITGLKREIDLLARVPIDAADEVLVCDLSMRRNRPALDGAKPKGRLELGFHSATSSAAPALPGSCNRMDTAPGTPLYNLPLLGEGTAQVESLTSYIVRLARAHYLRPRDLIRRVAGVGRPEIVALCYARFFSRYAITVNGLGKYARLFADRFSELTGNPNLAHATLLPWHRLLAPNGSALLAPHPRWCGQCLMEDVQAGRSPYLRLAWSVGLEKYCIAHHTLLDDVCPSCGRVQPAIPQYADLFHCDHCHQPLLSQETLHRPNGAKPAANDLLTTQSVADLIALNAVINPETTHLQFTAQLSREVERRTERNRAGLCRSWLANTRVEWLVH